MIISPYILDLKMYIRLVRKTLFFMFLRKLYTVNPKKSAEFKS